MRLPRFLRRFIPQTVACKGCGRVTYEYRRKPCRKCGAINKVVMATARDKMRSKDKAI